eukprot:GHVS01100245.1.p1 GENE.GHVS01100245.1~~GHVS01100245.1.p1  ORF type:complete len:137 (+),score=7.56 GHVS01100245.1:419-829(+)
MLPLLVTYVEDCVEAGLFSARFTVAQEARQTNTLLEARQTNTLCVWFCFVYVCGSVSCMCVVLFCVCVWFCFVYVCGSVLCMCVVLFCVCVWFCFVYVCICSLDQSYYSVCVCICVFLVFLQFTIFTRIEALQWNS